MKEGVVNFKLEIKSKMFKCNFALGEYGLESDDLHLPKMGGGAVKENSKVDSPEKWGR